MKKRFSEMTRTELEAEMESILGEIEKAEFPSQREILQSRYDTAKAYTLNPEQFTPGTYRVRGRKELFRLVYLNGVMAWGETDSEKEASFLISVLEKAE
ncbi:DUF1811 family protein [Paenibacillus hamazuiensis]|uniref:DUF1811 family protein n=1 Tax=Paenibacillus hamazuiensis TaxID=2936508 RepID=UPI00200D2E61|nr:DUF1811 family protein [Paenibacillus hamazuiensis]